MNTKNLSKISILISFCLCLAGLPAMMNAETVIIPAQSNDRTAAIMIDTFLAKQQAIKNKGIMVGAYNATTGLYENCTKGTAIVGNLNAQAIQLLINERQSADPNKPISITNVSNIADFICCVLFVGVNQCANNSAEDRAILAATYYPSDPVYDSAGNQIVNCDVSRNTEPGKAHQLGAKVTYNGVTDTFYYKPIGQVWTPSAAQIAGKPESADWENNANPTQEAINVLSMSFANLNSVLATKTPNAPIGCTADSGCADGKWCSYGTCCTDNQCGWGDGTNTPFECVANGGIKNNQWLTGICRNGVWKTQLNGAGCSSFMCDAGTCLNNVCTSSILGCTPKTCSTINSSRPYVCGIYADGCGGTLNCGACPSGQQCIGGACFASSLLNVKEYSKKVATTFTELQSYHGDCNAANAMSDVCSAAINRLCVAKGYVTGYGAIEHWGDNAQLTCLTKDAAAVLNVSFADLGNLVSSCTESVAVSDVCYAAINRYCAAAGYASGFGAVEHYNGNATIVCVNNAAATKIDVPFATLTALHGNCTESSAVSDACYSAINRHCGSFGYTSGFGAVEHSSGNAIIACVKP